MIIIITYINTTRFMFLPFTTSSLFGSTIHFARLGIQLGFGGLYFGGKPLSFQANSRM